MHQWVHYPYMHIHTHRQFFCTWIVLGRVGKNQSSSHPRLLSKTTFDNEDAEPHMDYPDSFQGGELHFDLPQFPVHCGVSFPGETHSQTPFDIHILWLQFWLTHWLGLAAYSLSLQLSSRASYNS